MPWPTLAAKTPACSLLPLKGCAQPAAHRGVPWWARAGLQVSAGRFPVPRSLPWDSAWSGGQPAREGWNSGPVPRVLRGCARQSPGSPGLCLSGPWPLPGCRNGPRDGARDLDGPRWKLYTHWARLAVSLGSSHMQRKQSPIRKRRVTISAHGNGISWLPSLFPVSVELIRNLPASKPNVRWEN